MLEVKNLRHQYQESDLRINFPDFQCDEGDHLLILGPSGSGKSTLLHILSGLLTPTEGNLILDGRDLGKSNAKAMADFRKENIGIVFQRHHFIQSLNAFENLNYAQYFTGTKSKTEELYELLELLDIKEVAHKKVYQLSEGQKQRLSIARAMVNHPRIILADEPSSSLDDKNCELLITMLKKAQEKYNSTLVIVSHDQRLIQYFSNRVELKKL